MSATTETTESFDDKDMLAALGRTGACCCSSAS